MKDDGFNEGVGGNEKWILNLNYNTIIIITQKHTKLLTFNYFWLAKVTISYGSAFQEWVIRASLICYCFSLKYADSWFYISFLYNVKNKNLGFYLNADTEFQ